MSKRPVNICSGQFGDLPLEELCRVMHEIGYNGIEIATQSHLDVRRVLSDPAYVAEVQGILKKYDMHIGAISAHLIGQCVGDNWDPRLDNFAPADCKGKPEAIRASRSQDPGRGRGHLLPGLAHLGHVVLLPPDHPGDGGGGLQEDQGIVDAHL